MKVYFLVATLLVLESSLAFAQKKVAVVKLLRGDVDVLTLGKTAKLKLEDWVEDGAVIKTAEKSFVKLIFTDKSSMNVGPSSEMKIEKFSDKDAGVIDLVKGKIRSQVTKDYLQMDKNKSKLFIKTQNAVMGVRGTDFMISTNGINTSTVLFEGEIAFNKLDARGEVNTSKLEDIVDRGVTILPGEFSVVESERPLPTVPAILNVHQRENLEKNENFESDRAPSSSVIDDSKKSVVPAGLSGSIVANNVVAVPVAEAQPKSAPADIAGFVQGDKIKPANGSFVHIETGTIIAPGSDSVLDTNTNSFIPVNKGTVNIAGEYVPPKNYEITAKGEILRSVVDQSGATVVQKVQKETPVVNAVNVNRSTASTSTSAIGTTTPVARPAAQNDVLNTRATPSGLVDLSNNARNITGGVDKENAAQIINLPDRVPTTIIVRPQD